MADVVGGPSSETKIEPTTRRRHPQKTRTFSSVSARKHDAVAVAVVVFVFLRMCVCCVTIGRAIRVTSSRRDGCRVRWRRVLLLLADLGNGGRLPFKSREGIRLAGRMCRTAVRLSILLWHQTECIACVCVSACRVGNDGTPTSDPVVIRAARKQMNNMRPETDCGCHYWHGDTSAT